MGRGLERRIRLDASPGSIRLARAFVWESLADRLEVDVFVVVLLASELATNAVVHAQSAFDVLVDAFPLGVEVSVIDESSVLPVMRVADVASEDGRGLLMVDALAEAWGVERYDAGKRTWFRVAPTARPGAKAVGL